MALAALTIASAAHAQTPGPATVWTTSLFSTANDGSTSNLHVTEGVEPLTQGSWKYRHWIKVDAFNAPDDWRYKVNNLICDGIMCNQTLELQGGQAAAYTWVADNKTMGGWNFSWSGWQYVWVR
jgi:hypothetical protein